MSAVVFVPSFFAAGVAVEEVRSAQREAALRALRETVRANSLMIDGQIERSLGALTALAQVRQLEPLFLRATYDQAAISFARQEFAPAREALAKLLQTNPQHERAKQLLALLPAPQ